jgi:hypothetical protein
MLFWLLAVDFGPLLMHKTLTKIDKRHSHSLIHSAFTRRTTNPTNVNGNHSKWVKKSENNRFQPVMGGGSDRGRGGRGTNGANTGGVGGVINGTAEKCRTQTGSRGVSIVTRICRGNRTMGLCRRGRGRPNSRWAMICFEKKKIM